MMNLHAPKGIDVESWFIECYKKYKGHPLRILVGLYKGNYNKFFLAIIFFFIKHSPVWVLPIITANIINNITSGASETYSNILIESLIMVILIGINIPTNYMYTRYKSLATRYAETGLRKALVRKLQQLSISYHKETQSGRLQSKIMRDVEAVETLSTQMFLSILNIVLNIGIALAVTISKSIMVFIFFLLTTPIAALTMVFFRNVMRKRNNEFRREMEETSAKVMEMVELIPVTRAHALEEEEVHKMSGQLFAVAEKGYKLDVIQSLFGSVGWAIFQVFQVVCLAFTGVLALKSVIQPGDITLYQSYFATIVAQVSSLMSLIPTIAKGVESVNSIGEVLLEEDIEKNEGKEVLDDVKGEFEFNDVYLKYSEDGRNVLNGLNLKVKQGETIALVGESGAGKSTILNLVIGFNFANSGQVLLDGKDLSKIDLRSYRKHLAVVPQTSILFSGTIRDNITLIRNPEVIVLDEATSALDSISEKLIQDSLNNLTAGRTTFIVAHRLSTIKDADKIAVIADGKCVEYGTFDELMALKGEFYQMKVIQS